MCLPVSLLSPPGCPPPRPCLPSAQGSRAALRHQPSTDRPGRAGGGQPGPGRSGEKRDTPERGRWPLGIPRGSRAHLLTPESLVQLLEVRFHLTPVVFPLPGLQSLEMGDQGLEVLSEDCFVQALHRLCPTKRKRMRKVERSCPRTRSPGLRAQPWGWGQQNGPQSPSSWVCGAWPPTQQA